VWTDGSNDENFISWTDLQAELQRQLLPQLFANPSGFKFETRDHHGKSQWLVQVFDDRGDWFCDVWFGNDPDNGWSFDGLVRLGDPVAAPHAWQTYQRYSDGTYRRLPSRSPNLDQFRRKK
jgi:hypothetical protein